jgi:hypothetical protein
MANTGKNPIAAVSEKNVIASLFVGALPFAVPATSAPSLAARLVSDFEDLPTGLAEWPTVSNRTLFHHKVLLVHGHSTV